MSPILDIQARFRELGRIRTGVKVPTGKLDKRGNPGMRPTKLPRFRLTSPWQHLIEQAADLFGGEAKPWENEGAKEWEVIVEDEVLPVAVPPGVDVLDAWYERWEGGGLMNRCDGFRQTLVDRPCRCPGDPLERAEAATKGAACKPTTRIRLMIPDLADVGIWRLETHGFHAFAELSGAASLIEAATRRGIIVPADLRLQAREGSRRPGKQRTKFFVPALTFRASAGAILEAFGSPIADTPVELGVQTRPSLAAGGVAELPPARTPLDPHRPPVEAASIPPPPPLDPTPPKAPTPDVDLEPGPPPATEPARAEVPDLPEPDAFDPPEPEVDPQTAAEGPRLSPAQIIAMRLRDRGISDRNDKLRIVAAMIGRDVASSKDLTAREVREVLDRLSDPGYVLPAGPLPPTEGRTAEPEPDAPNPAPGTALRGDLVPPGPPPADGGFDPLEAPSWTADQWRRYFAARGVKAAPAMGEARKIAVDIGDPEPSSIDDLVGGSSSLVGLLCAWVEDQHEARSRETGRR